MELATVYEKFKNEPPPRRFYVIGYEDGRGCIELLDKTFVSYSHAKDYAKKNAGSFLNSRLYIFEQELGKLEITIST